MERLNRLSSKIDSLLGESEKRPPGKIVYTLVIAFLISYLSLSVLGIFDVISFNKSGSIDLYKCALLFVITTICVAGVASVVSRKNLIVCNRYLWAGFFGTIFSYLFSYEPPVGGVLNFYSQLALGGSAVMFWSSLFLGMAFLFIHDIHVAMGKSGDAMQLEPIPYMKLLPLVLSIELLFRPIINMMFEGNGFDGGSVVVGFITFLLTAGIATIIGIYWDRSGLDRGGAYATISGIIGLWLVYVSGHPITVDLFVSGLPFPLFLVGYVLTIGILFVLDRFFLRSENPYEKVSME